MSQDINKTLSQDLDEPTPVLPDVVLESGLVDIQTVEEVTATQPPYGTLPVSVLFTFLLPRYSSILILDLQIIVVFFSSS